MEKERIAREIIQEDIGKNVVFSIDGRISGMPKFNAKHIMAAMFKFHDKMCESKNSSTSDEALPIADVGGNEVALIEPLRNFIRTNHLTHKWDAYLKEWQENQ